MTIAETSQRFEIMPLPFGVIRDIWSETVSSNRTDAPSSRYTDLYARCYRGKIGNLDGQPYSLRDNQHRAAFRRSERLCAHEAIDLYLLYLYAMFEQLPLRTPEQ